MSLPVVTKLIVVYAGFGDTLLLQYRDQNTGQPKYWLIDGGPVSDTRVTINGIPGRQGYHAYYQYLRQALLRFCRSGALNPDGSRVIDRLAGIIVTHPHEDHMDGIIQLIADWLPDGPRDDPSAAHPLSFNGPVILNDIFFPSTLSRLLMNRKGFVRRDVGPGDLPGEMTNQAIGHPMSALVRGAPSFPQLALEVDGSHENRSSIITLWQEAGNLPLITTGDSIGSRILACLNSDPNQPITDLGIFKVPHHGSKFNSLENHTYNVTDAESDSEKHHFLFMVLLACYFAVNPLLGMDDALVNNITQLVALVRTFYADWKITDACTEAQFEAICEDFSQRFRGHYLVFQQFLYLDLETGETLDLSEPDDDTNLGIFLGLLVARHQGILEMVYANDPIGAHTRRQVSLVGSQVLISQNTDINATRNFDATDLMNIKKGYLPAERQGALWQVMRTYQRFFKVIFKDYGGSAQFQLGIFSFYRSFRANNYVISAQWQPHGHPTPEVVAGIMAAAILQIRTPPEPTRRLFVTDGASIQSDLIYKIVKDLLEGHFHGVIPPQYEDWSQGIRLFYLHTDFCAAIPLDFAPVAGVEELDFSPANDSREARDLLHREMVRAGAYDIPRATNSNTSSFSMYVQQGQTEQFVSYDARNQRFSLQNSRTGAWVFTTQFIGRSTLPNARDEPEYDLYASTIDPLTGRPTAPVQCPSSVMFIAPRSSPPTTRVSFKMYNTTMTEILSQYIADPSILSLQAQNAQGWQPFSFSFYRESGFGEVIIPNAPEPTTEVEAYLRTIGSSEDPTTLTIVSLGCSIAGRDQMTAFLTALPTSITVITDLPTWLTDVSETRIDFASSPFGVDVRRASIRAVIPETLKQLEIGGLRLSISTAMVQFDNVCHTPKIVLLLSVKVSSLQLELEVSWDHEGPMTLEFRSSGEGVVPLDILRLLSITSGSSLDIPLGGGTVDLGALEETVGFTLIQPCTGTTDVVHLETIFFTFSANWDSWKQILPDILQPGSSVTLNIILIQPTITPFTVALQFDYLLPVSDELSPIQFRLSYRPNKGTGTERISAGFRVQPANNLPAPSIDIILSNFFDKSWADVVAAIPVLGSIATAITVTDASFELENRTIKGFSLRAVILNLTILETPLFVVEDAHLDLLYNGQSWSGTLATQLQIGIFLFKATVNLPTTDSAGSLEFKNLNNDLTFGTLLAQIDPSLDPKSVPLIGDSISTARIDSASFEISLTGNTPSMTAFQVTVVWGKQSVGPIKTSASQLGIGWQKAALQSVPSVAGPATATIVSNHWRIHWEGPITESWYLSADLQYSNIQTDPTKSGQFLVASGAILNVAGKVEAGPLVDSTTSMTDIPDTLWETTIPRNVQSEFTLRQCAVNCALGPATIMGVGAEIKYGVNGSGTAALLVQRANEDNPWAFALAIRVSNFHFSDLLRDSQLATMIDQVFVITDVSVLVFDNAGSTSLASVVADIKNMGTCNMFPPDLASSGLPLQDVQSDVPITFTSGLAVFAVLDFAGAPDQTLAGNLALVSQTSLSRLTILGYFGKASDSKPAVIFTASLSLVQLFDSIALHNIVLTYAPKIVNGVQSNYFSLAATCVIKFSGESSWSISGALTVRDIDAKLAFTTEGNLTLSEMLNLTISNVNFSGTYTFSSSSASAGTSLTRANEGRLASYQLQLSATVLFGSVHAKAYAVFKKGTPEVFAAELVGQLSLTTLLQSVFDNSSDVPPGVMDVSFSGLLIYYAWNASVKPPPEHTGPRGGKYLAGFHAESALNLFGIDFLLLLDIVGGDASKKGVRLTGAKSTPVEVVMLVLHGENAPDQGPSFGLSTCASDKGCFVAAGVTLLGTEIGSIKLSYDPSKSRFFGAVDVKASFIPDVQVQFELVKKDGKYLLRFVGLPSVFQDVIDSLQIAQELEKLSKQDGSPCGAIELIFDQLDTTVNLKINIPDDQPGLSPGGSDTGTRYLNLLIGGTLDLTFATKVITGIDFDVFTLPLVLPEALTLEAFGQSLKEWIKKLPDAIINGLWNNKGKLAAVIALAAFWKMGAKALASLICRGYYDSPSPDTGDEPGPDQTPDPSDDGGGADGDAGSGSGAGEGAAEGGSAAGEAAADGGASAETLPFEIFDLFGVPYVSKTPPPSPPSPGSPPPPSESDSFAQAIYAVINKDFNRWTNCADYESAITTALNCAEEYRDAIALLRKVLQSSTTAPKLGAKEYADYHVRRTKLVYDFSLMSRSFAQRWLDMKHSDITMGVTDDNRSLQLSWEPLHVSKTMDTVVTVVINGSAKTVAHSSTNTVLVDISQFGPDDPLNVDVNVTAMAATWREKGSYVFYSQGRPYTDSETIYM